MNAKVIMGTRLLLGLVFVAFGLNGLLMVTGNSGFIPMPPPAPEVADIMGGFFKIGYLMPLVKVLQVTAGVLLLSGMFVNLALLILGPIIVNIVCVHLFIDLSGLPMALIITVLYSIQIYSRWNDFKIFLKK
jgi:putative oxidoreductase